MKRLFVLILLFSLLISCLGCGKNNEQFTKPAKFYYLNEEITYGVEDGLISYELQETNHIAGDLLQLLQQYQQGPVNKQLISTLPADVNISSVVIQGGVITVTTDVTFNQLNGMDRTIACACISLTLLDYTGAEYVEFNIVDAFQNERERIIFSREDMHLLDHHTVPTESNP